MPLKANGLHERSAPKTAALEVTVIRITRLRIDWLRIAVFGILRLETLRVGLVLLAAGSRISRGPNRASRIVP